MPRETANDMDNDKTTKTQQPSERAADSALSASPSSVQVWQIEPAENTSYDYEVSRVSNDPDGRNAMKRAQQILESKWDSAESLEDLEVTVTLRRGFMYEDELPEGI
jgi:hypothetical protein